MGEDQAGLAVFEHEGQSLGGVVRIEGDVGCAGLEDGQEADDHLDGALQADGDALVGSDAQGDQVMGQPVGSGVEFAVAEGLVLEDEGAGVGARAACSSNS